MDEVDIPLHDLPGIATHLAPEEPLHDAHDVSSMLSPGPNLNISDEVMSVPLFNEQSMSHTALEDSLGEPMLSDFRVDGYPMTSASALDTDDNTSTTYSDLESDPFPMSSASSSLRWDDRNTHLNNQVSQYLRPDALEKTPVPPPPLAALGVEVLSPPPLQKVVPDSDLSLAKLIAKPQNFIPPTAPLTAPVTVKIEPVDKRAGPAAALLEATKLAASAVTPSQRAAAERKENERLMKAAKQQKPTVNLMGVAPDVTRKRKEPTTEEDRREMKKQQRLMRNRISAQLSRERKKAYVSSLEAQMQELVAGNKQLAAKVEELMAENSTLKKRLGESPSSSPPNSPLYSTVSAEDDNSAPPAKRPRSNKRYAARTTLVAFALVFSFGVFYHMIGLDVTKEGVSLSHLLAENPDIPQTVFRGRVLNGLGDTKELASGDENAVSTIVLPSKATTDSSVESKQQPMKQSVKVLNQAHLQTLSKKLQQKLQDDGFELPQLTAEGTSMGSSAGVTRIHINSDASAEDQAIAVDIYQRNQHIVQDQLKQAMEMYKKMLLQTNSSNLDDINVPSSIMFCPSAIHIQPRLLKTVVTNSNSNSTTVDFASPMLDDSLPSTNPKAKDSLDPTKMLVWVPSNSIAADWGNLFSLDETEPGDKPSGVTEINVKVIGVRPLMEPKA